MHVSSQTVTDAPTVTVSHTSELAGSFVLHCNTTGFPPPSVEWQYQAGANVNISSLNNSLTENTLFIRTLSIELSPTNQLLEFTCIAVTLYNGLLWTANETISINAGIACVHDEYCM